jgi:hypothetical protein
MRRDGEMRVVPSEPNFRASDSIIAKIESECLFCMLPASDSRQRPLPHDLIRLRVLEKDLRRADAQKVFLSLFLASVLYTHREPR